MGIARTTRLDTISRTESRCSPEKRVCTYIYRWLQLILTLPLQHGSSARPSDLLRPRIVWESGPTKGQ